VARSVKEFHEYYCITNNPTRPAPIKLSTDGNLILDKTTNETTKTTTVTTKYDTGDTTWEWILDDKDEVPSIEQGEWLWNQEVVEYTTKDNKGENKYSTTSV
jgi:hypothetical protein